jgi:putative heme-binding domain-containing protein
MILDPKTPAEELPRYFRAFDLLPSETTKPEILALAFADIKGDAERKNFITTEAFDRMKGVDINKDPKAKGMLIGILENSVGTEKFVELVGKFSVSEMYLDLLKMAQAKPDEQLGVEAMRTLLSKNQMSLINQGVNNEDPVKSEATVKALGNASDKRAENLLWTLIDNAKTPLGIRRAAVTGAARSQNSANKLARLASDGKLDADIKDAVASALHTSQWPEIKAQAAKLFPLPAAKNNKPLPPIEDLVKRQGDAQEGRVLYNTTATCVKCHIVNNVGREVGPDLSEIGKKLSREAMYQSILFPSAGISHNYESYLLALADGTTVTGLVPSRTEEEISVKNIEGLVLKYKMADVEIIKKQNISLMPADLQKVMSEEDLVNVVEYLTTLREAKKLGNGGEEASGKPETSN